MGEQGKTGATERRDKDERCQAWPADGTGACACSCYIYLLSSSIFYLISHLHLGRLTGPVLAHVPAISISLLHLSSSSSWTADGTGACACSCYIHLLKTRDARHGRLTGPALAHVPATSIFQLLELLASNPDIFIVLTITIGRIIVGTAATRDALRDIRVRRATGSQLQVDITTTSSKDTPSSTAAARTRYRTPAKGTTESELLTNNIRFLLP